MSTLYRQYCADESFKDWLGRGRPGGQLKVILKPQSRPRPECVVCHQPISLLACKPYQQQDEQQQIDKEQNE